MNATQLIMDTLRAMGAAPTVTTNKSGVDTIKINAPVLNAGDNANNREDNEK